MVIPHHTRVDLLERALRAVSADWPVLVVDDSPDGVSLQVDTVRTQGSTGFARACNAGLEEAQARGYEWAVVLNDDACPDAACIGLLLERAQAGATLVGPVVLDPSGKVESAGIRVSLKTGRVRSVQVAPERAGPVDALSGACLLLPASLRFDPGFEHGMEDVELSLRVRAAGGRVELDPRARCVHRGGATLGRRTQAATRGALKGHLRLVRDSRSKQAVAVALSVAQIVRERGPLSRLVGVGQAVRQTYWG